MTTTEKAAAPVDKTTEAKMPRRVAMRLGFSMMPLTTRSPASSGDRSRKQSR